MAQRVNFLRPRVSKTPRYKILRWAWGLLLGVVVLVLGYEGWPALAVPSASDNETQSRQLQELLQEYQSLQDQQRLLTSWTAQRWQVLDAIHHLATGWPSLWVLAPSPALSLTSLHVSAQEVRIQALSRGAPELPRWDPRRAPPSPPRSTLGPPELLELTHTAPAAPSGTTAAAYWVSVRLPWRGASDSSSPPTVTPAISQGGDLQGRLDSLRQSLAQQQSEHGVSSDLSTMVADLQQGLNQANLQVQSLKPGVAEIKGPWTRCPMALKATGSFASLMKFLVATSHRPGVVALTPLTLVRQGAMDGSKDREPPDVWTMDLTVTRAWHHHAATTQPPLGPPSGPPLEPRLDRPLGPWPLDDAKVQSALHALLPRQSAGDLAHRAHNAHSPDQRLTPFESDLQALRDQVEQGQLTWVGFMASQGPERALIRWNGRVSVVLVGERLSSGPWRVVRASAIGAELAWLGVEAHKNPVHPEVQVGPRGVHLLSTARGAS